MATNKLITIVMLTLILFDIVTGITQALKNKSFKSSVMREGLYHKVGILFLLALGIGIDMSQTIIDLGFTIPTFKFVATYVGVMEISSILENIYRINSDLVPEKIQEILKGGVK